MPKHHNPEPGETWYHPRTFNAYRIHSLSSDGWVRYQVLTPENRVLPVVTTMPTLEFIQKYVKEMDGNV